MKFEITVRKMGHYVSTEVRLIISQVQSYVACSDEPHLPKGIFHIEHNGRIVIDSTQRFNALIEDLKRDCLSHLSNSLDSSMRIG